MMKAFLFNCKKCTLLLEFYKIKIKLKQHEILYK